MEKCMRIVSDIVGFCHSEGAEDIQISISHDKKNNASGIAIGCLIPGLSPKTVSFLTGVLNSPRQHEVEHDYWLLDGDSEMPSELTLTGMMIDSAEVSYENGFLTIRITRED